MFIEKLIGSLLDTSKRFSYLFNARRTTTGCRFIAGLVGFESGCETVRAVGPVPEWL